MIHAARAAYRMWDQNMETRRDGKTVTGWNRPEHSPAKDHEDTGSEAKSPAPRKQRTKMDRAFRFGAHPKIKQTKNIGQTYTESTIVRSYAIALNHSTFTRPKTVERQRKQSCMFHEWLHKEKQETA